MASATVWEASPMWEPRRDSPTKQIPVVLLRALSAEDPAIEALPIIDSPAFREMAQKFLSDEACGTVAEVYLGGGLMDLKAAMTVFGWILPEERADLVAMLGRVFSYAPQQRPHALRQGLRRVARRG